MSFTDKKNEKFSTVYSKPLWKTKDVLIKSNYLPQGKNMVFGSDNKDQPNNLLYLGKVIENSSGSSYLASDCWLDISFPHVIYITGTRGSGKSFDLGVLIEGISKLSKESKIQENATNAASILIDTQSQFWTLKYEPRENITANLEQIELLKKWNIKPNSLADCQIFIPEKTEKITGDEQVFYIDPSTVEHAEWCALIREEVYSPQGHILRETLKSFDGSYGLTDIIDYVKNTSNFPNVADNARNALAYKLEDLEDSGLFGQDAINIEDLLLPGRCSIFMLRDLENSDKSLITGIIARQLFTFMGAHHSKRKVDLFFDKNQSSSNLASKVWLLIDEAHVVAPREGFSAARNSLIEYVKRGRDAGLSLVLATQQPSAVDNRILSQVNISLSHRLTFENDCNACIDRIPTRKLKQVEFGGRALSDFSEMISLLEPGQCFIGDSHTSRVITAAIRPRVTSHGGYSPE